MSDILRLHTACGAVREITGNIGTSVIVPIYKQPRDKRLRPKYIKRVFQLERVAAYEGGSIAEYREVVE